MYSFRGKNLYRDVIICLMKLVVGIGNPGKDYEKTRHNVGFMLLEQFLKDYEPIRKTVWENNTKLKSDIAEIFWQGKNGKNERIILVKPKTYMNNSGMAVSLITSFYKIEPENVWILHDDVDFPIGSMRIRFGGASAGHRGVMSIIESLGSDKFWRFRLGIGRPGESEHSGVSHYVLDRFSHQDHAKVREMLHRGVKAIEVGLQDDLQAAMNQFNTK